MTGVYGPQAEADKVVFMQELRDVQQTAGDRWLLLGDFNLIYRMCDKNNDRINRNLMNSFRRVLDDIEMKKIHLHGPRFTWTSGTKSPTQTKIDHIFASKEWGLLYPECHLQAAGSSVSDHCPMILSCSPTSRRYKGFRFESYWLQMPEFKEIVAQSWVRPVSASNKVRALHIKLSRLAKALKKWHRQRMAESRREEKQAQELVLRLDQTQDQLQLTET
jgi:hypothetical protein